MQHCTGWWGNACEFSISWKRLGGAAFHSNSIGPTPIVFHVPPCCTTFASTITVMYSSYTVHIKLTTMAKMPQSGPAWPRVAHINQGDPETNFKSILSLLTSIFVCSTQIFVVFFCFRCSFVCLLQFSSVAPAGRLTSNFRFLCGRGNWIVCWISGGQTQRENTIENTRKNREVQTYPAQRCKIEQSFIENHWTESGTISKVEKESTVDCIVESTMKTKLSLQCSTI